MIKRVELTTEGPGGRLVVDGQDISNGVRAVDIQVNGEDLPRVTVELNVFAYQAGHDGAETRLYLTDEARKALLMFGWTPPVDEVGDSDAG
jgi:hypothetical protein